MTADKLIPLLIKTDFLKQQNKNMIVHWSLYVPIKEEEEEKNKKTYML